MPAALACRGLVSSKGGKRKGKTAARLSKFYILLEKEQKPLWLQGPRVNVPVTSRVGGTCPRYVMSRAVTSGVSCTKAHHPSEVRQTLSQVRLRNCHSPAQPRK